MPDRPQALRIVNALRQGANCLDGVSLFSVGRKWLFDAAREGLEELELSDGSSVRWIKGRYGYGKTHFFARLVEMALERNWVSSFVQISGKGQGIELHRFEEVYGAIASNCICRQMVEEESGRIEPGRVSGLEWVLDRWFSEIRKVAVGSSYGDTPTLRMQDTINQTITAIQKKWALHSSFSEALRQFAIARADEDQAWSEILLKWFRGENVHGLDPEIRKRLRNTGIRESVSRRNAKEILRSLSIFFRYRGYGGVLILFDEVENVLHETPSARRSAYIILRELIDNVDDLHGMTRTAFYISATPDLFDSDKGLTEHEALAMRVLLPVIRKEPNPATPVVDLGAFPLRREDYLQIAGHVADIYAIAKARKSEGIDNKTFPSLFDRMHRTTADLNPRLWIRAVVDHLDRVATAR